MHTQGQSENRYYNSTIALMMSNFLLAAGMFIECFYYFCYRCKKNRDAQIILEYIV